ncbi:TSUP family transporter [Colwellia echini]|uniref:Probable membrane transporter protein n=1 Tax=Colwellia echini TaxID=1982103 RepID=A0ABY3MYG6_9GAMM|nr:TSUP family transporter [Colwellia echini]TYK66129.1 TSUP family transporter [Colwellia echini]
MEFANLTLEIVLFLFAVAIVAGFLDTLAGGGGLLTLPALMISGIPPLLALGTNKLQACMGTATASFMMLRKKRVTFQQVKFLMLSAFIGSSIGTLFIQIIDVELLTLVIPIVISCIGLYFLFAPTIEEGDRPAKISSRAYKTIVVPLIGFYDGLFGPGTGSFFTLAGRALQGQQFLDATARAKTLNFATNIASLIVFLFAGKVFWLVGFTMMFGQFIGAWLGSHCLFKIPVKYLRYLVVIMCFSMLAKYLTS